MSRFGVACALATVAVLRIYSVASAHVTLVSSSPAANSRIDASPTQFRLEFSEPLDAKVAKVSLMSPDGTSAELALTSDPRNAYVLIAPSPVLAAGSYRVVWRVLSDDGHPVTGSFVFSIGETVSAAPEPPGAAETVATWGPAFAGAPVIPSVLRGLGVGALAALAGMLFFLTRYPASTGADARGTGVVTALAIAAPVFLIAHLCAWLINAAPDHRLSGEWVSSALSTAAGRGELVRAVFAVLPALALLLARRPRIALLLAAVGLLASAAVGHSTAYAPIWSVPLKAVHLLALAAWLGGLIWLVMRDRADIQRFVADAARVSSIALASVVAIGLTGVAQAWIIIPTRNEIDTPYGVGSLLKLVGLAVLVGFGAYHRYRLMPRLAGAASSASNASASLATSLRREIAVLWVVVLVGGFLAYVPPPTTDSPVPSTSTGSNQ